MAAIGITNQRETVVAWDRRSGQPLHRAIVWQDRRTAERCDELRDAGHLPLVRERTGLVLDPYFSATKMAWLLGPGGRRSRPRSSCSATVDAWVLWNLTGGTDGGVLATDASNAARTLLFDIRELAWSDELCALFGVPRERPARRPPVVRAHRHRGRSARGGDAGALGCARERRGRRPAGRALRPGVLLAGHDQSDLRDGHASSS